MKHKGDIDLGGNDLNNVGSIGAGINSLNDVNTALPAIGEILSYDGAEWVNDNITLSLGQLSNVTETTPTNGQFLKYNGTAWVNAAEASDNLASTDQTLVADRDVVLDGNSLLFESSVGSYVLKMDSDGVIDVGGGDSLDAGVIQFHEAQQGLNFVALKAPNSLTANTTYTLPSADGTNGQVLTTNGTGTMSWTTASGGGGTPLASANQTLTADRLIDTNGYNLEIELDPTGTADTFKVHDGTHDLFEVNTNTSGTLFSVNDVSGLPTFQSNDTGSMVLPKILTAAPTGTATEGTMQLAIVTGTCYLYVYINGGWKSTTLT